MKTILSILTIVACSAGTQLYAQDVTTPSKQATDTIPASPSASYLKDMIKIQPSEIPSQLRATLESPAFTGWEDGIIYRSKNNDAFVVQMRDKTYQFDENGKLIKEN